MFFASGGLATLSDQFVKQFAIEVVAAQAAQTGGQSIQGTTRLIDIGDPRSVNRGHQQAAPARAGAAGGACVQHEAVFFEQAQRLQHRLARHRQLRRNVVLLDARPGAQRAVADGIQQRAIDLIDQVGGGFQFDQLAHGGCSVVVIQGTGRIGNSTA